MRSKKHGLNWIRISAGLLGAVILLGALLVLVIRLFPSAGALGADQLRHILGDENVARMEAILFKVDDGLKSVEYRLGLVKNQAPWATNIASSPSSPAVTPQEPVATPNQMLTAPLPEVKNPPSGNIATILPVIPGKVFSDPVSGPWVLKNLAPMGDLAGEGVWTPYIQDSQGHVVAYRTFLQPDASRPYALVAVVAFNLQAAQLHFVLGTTEPYDSSVTQRARGTIPSSDLTSSQLIAAFNGGFKVAHGHFGAMAGGLVAVPPKPGLATLVIDQNGTVKIGEWGVDINPSANMLAYRQNGLLIVKDGVVTSQVDNPKYWGFTISGKTVTWRSAIGLDASGKVLYYFAGGYLNINTLASEISQAGVQTAMQLDINNYWVHFDAIRTVNGNLVPEPLFKEMNQDPSRFIKPWIRDFFSVTLK